MIAVLDRKHHPVPELIVDAPLLVKSQQPGFLQQLIRIAPGPQIGCQIRGGAVRKPQAEFLHRLICQTSSRQILIACPPSGIPQHIIIVARRLLIDLQQPGTPALLLPCFLIIFHLRQIDSCPVCQYLHRFLKRSVLIFHQKCDHIAARPAAETVEDLLGLGYREGGRFFIMKRAQPEIIAPLLLYADITRDHINDIIFRSDLLDQFFRIIHIVLSLCITHVIKHSGASPPLSHARSLECRSPDTALWQSGPSWNRYSRRRFFQAAPPPPSACTGTSAASPYDSYSIHTK